PSISIFTIRLVGGMCGSPRFRRDCKTWTSERNVTKYDAKFYKSFRNLTYSSAREVVPLILQLMPVISVCDVGCGDGTWLRVFRDEGVTDVVGIDGEYMTKDLLQVPLANFQPMDLRQQISVQRSFDLAIS